MTAEIRKPYKSDLTDAQWGRIKPLLLKPAKTGRPRSDDREVINGILYILSTGCRYEDLPHDIKASGKTCNRRLLEYQRKYVWQRIQQDLMKEADRRGKINLNNAYHDASVVKSKRGASIRSVSLESTRLKA
jgi:transposase